jgi:hypothetical protein
MGSRPGLASSVAIVGPARDRRNNSCLLGNTGLDNAIVGIVVVSSLLLLRFSTCG